MSNAQKNDKRNGTLPSLLVIFSLIMLRRFQLLTKTPDPLIAKTYLAISGEPIFSYEDEEKTEKPRMLEGEEAAVARWFDDEDWEAAQGTSKGKGKGKGWFGKAGSTDKGKWVTRAPVGVAEVAAKRG